MTNNEEKIEQVKKAIEKAKNRPDLVIQRVPKKVLERFKEDAKEYNENDYGMQLKDYMMYHDLFHTQIAPLMMTLQDVLSSMNKVLEKLLNRGDEDEQTK